MFTYYLWVSGPSDCGKLDILLRLWQVTDIYAVNWLINVLHIYWLGVQKVVNVYWCITISMYIITYVWTPLALWYNSQLELCNNYTAFGHQTFAPKKWEVFWLFSELCFVMHCMYCIYCFKVFGDKNNPKTNNFMANMHTHQHRQANTLWKMSTFKDVIICQTNHKFNFFKTISNNKCLFYFR